MYGGVGGRSREAPPIPICPNRTAAARQDATHSEAYASVASAPPSGPLQLSFDLAGARERAGARRGVMATAACGPLGKG